jgi:uncharacterized protein YerC
MGMGKIKSKQDKKVLGFRTKRRKSSNDKMEILSPKNVKKIERQYQVVQLRRDGYSHKEIAETLGISVSCVHTDLITCLNRTLTDTAENADQQRQIEEERLDLLVKTYTPLATQEYKTVAVDRRTGQPIVVVNPPNPQYAGILLQVSGQRAKLKALNLPEVKKVEVTGVREYVGVDLDKV